MSRPSAVRAASCVGLLGLSGLLLPNAALADPPQFLADAWQRWQTLRDAGSPAIYASGYIWHDPQTYSAQKLASLNQAGWGVGWGKQLNAPGGQDMVYALAFLDSHRALQPMLGYARQWTWSPAPDLPSLGLGYTAGLTARADMLHNAPFPIALPLASLSWGRFTVFGAFLPRLNGMPNNGNVAFVFARYRYGP